MEKMDNNTQETGVYSDGRIAINGWLEAAQMGVEELIESFRNAGLSQVICTDIAKDGMLSGPSVPLYVKLQKLFLTFPLLLCIYLCSAQE